MLDGRKALIGNWMGTCFAMCFTRCSGMFL